MKRLLHLSCLFVVLVAVQAGCLHRMEHLGQIQEGVDCIAILPFEIRNDIQRSEEFLSEYLSLDLGKEGFEGLIGPRGVKKELKKKNIQLPPTIDMLWAREMGGEINVDGVVYGNISRIPIRTDRKELEKNPRVLLDVDVHFLDLRRGEITWTFGTREVIFLEEYPRELSRVSERMAVSFLGPRLQTERIGSPKCWQTEIAKKKDSSKSETAKGPEGASKSPKFEKLTVGQKKILQKLGRKEVIQLDSTFFEGRSARFTKAAIPFLRNLEGLMSSGVGPKRVVIHSHIDASGNAAQDLEASEYRAQAIESYLESLGIDSKRIEVKSYGGSKPKVPNLNKKARRMNRRIEIEAEFAAQE